MGAPPKYLVEDYIGKKFGRLTVIADAGSKLGNYQQKRRHVFCQCDCGNSVEVYFNNLINKRCPTLSCGCLDKEKSTERIVKISHRHGMIKTKVYRTWLGIKDRCFNPKSNKYYLYGGRGITIFDRWIDSFEIFWEYVGNPPTPRHTIDRIDGNKGYEPHNVRWSTYTEQNNNRSNNVFITYKETTQTIGQWAKQLNINYSLLQKRIQVGWEVEKALFTPSRKK